MSKKSFAEALPEPEPVYIVVHAILEDGKHYKPGKKYTGKRVDRFLKGGQIRKQEG